MRRAWYATMVGYFLMSTIALMHTEAKVFTHCELAQELRRLQIPESQIAIWVCIAHYESRLNSSTISGTGDHGIFQISEEYWCSPRGRGKACGLSCAELEDDNISDDVECVQTIFEEHQGLSGNGFNAWAVYPRCKKSSNANRFIKKCTSVHRVDNSIDSVDLRPRFRFGTIPYSTAPRESFSAKSSSSSSPSQDIRFSPFQQGYDYSRKWNSFSSTTTSPFQLISRSPSAAVHVQSSKPSIYSTSRPSSYSVGSIYYNPFETKSTTPAPTFSPRKSSSFSNVDNSRTLFGFTRTSAPQVHTRSDNAAVKTSSPAPTLKIKAPWADFPWWNGGK